MMVVRKRQMPARLQAYVKKKNPQAPARLPVPAPQPPLSTMPPVSKTTFAYDDIHNVPVLVICYNNYLYVRNMVGQLEKIRANIFILDNNSTCQRTRSYLDASQHKVIRLSRNGGHLVWQDNIIYDCLPDRFIITDPDLEFRSSTPPESLIETLFAVSDKHKPQRVGLALDISDYEKMFPYGHIHDHLTIRDIEQAYWKETIPDATDGLELYYADIDTTFCLYAKHFEGRHIRVAGNFTVKHLPWYVDTPGISRYEKHLMYKDANTSSNIKAFEERYMREHNIIVIPKHNELILARLDGDANDHFWKHVFSSWEDETFCVFDRYLSPDKPFLDIGAWIGTTCVYAMRKSSRVVCVEADPVSVKKLKHHVYLNGCGTPVDIIEKAIYHQTGIDVVFGPNKFSPHSQWNESTSQIKDVRQRHDDICVPTISLDDIIQGYGLKNASLIKVDIEGGEELIMDDLAKHIGKIPIYLSFHYSWWTDKNLARFSFLTDAVRQQIIANPFISILFPQQ